MLFCGLRLGETTSLRIEDVELSERKGLVHLRGHSTKGGKERVVPVPATARRVLGEYLDQRGREPGPLFLGERGPLGRNGLTRVVARYASTAGVRMSPHTLRHAYAYNFLQQTGNDLVALASLMGHSNLNTTMVYTRRRLEDLEAAVEGMDFA
jgi:integrase/recombinase XerC